MSVKPKKSQSISGAPIQLAMIILAKDEASKLAHFFEQLAKQSLCVNRDVKLTLYLAANGCTDRTAAIAREQAQKYLHPHGVMSVIFDWEKPGKSRSWNRLVHDVLPPGLDYIVAIDADIEFADTSILASMLDHIRASPTLQVLSGSPAKDSVRKARPTLVNRFSNSASRLGGYTGVINGSLYLAKAQCLKEIWLPDETPGEDGFLNAMVMTRGFSRPALPNVVMQMPEPTHYFEDHSPASFFAHEKRMIVGTTINRWIFEYLHSLELSEPAGPLIQRLNREEPDWVEQIIAKQSARKWIIPRALLFRRLLPKGGLTASYLLRLPILILATALTLPPALEANKALKKRGASSLW